MESKPTSEPVAHPRLTKLMHSPIIWAVLSILSILGIVLTIITFFPPTKKQFTYSVDSRVVLSADESLLDDLEINYMGNRITNLRSTIIKIWNSGSEAIRGNDIAGLRPLAIIMMQSDNIYNASIIEVSNKANQFACKWAPGDLQIAIDFEYTNPNDYVILQILHSSPFTFRADTEIIGVEKGSIKLADPSKDMPGRFYVLLPITICLNIFVVAFVIKKARKQISRGEFICFFILLIGSGITTIWTITLFVKLLLKN